MATTPRPSARPQPLWNSKWVEWGALVVVLLIVGTVLVRYAQQARFQAEFSTVTGTLSALRTALVVHHIDSKIPRAQAAAGPAAGERNPFVLLEQLPTNYVGEFQAAMLDAVPPGSWVYDSRCGCVGYKPHDPIGLQAPEPAQALWFVVEATKDVPQLRPMQPYVWAGQAVE